MDINYSWGIDCGSSEIKVVVCDSRGQLLHQYKTRTLFPLLDHVRKAIAGCAQLAATSPGLSPFEEDGVSIKPGHHITTTGYGRNYLDFAHQKLTEIKAHFLGIHHSVTLSEPYTIIDIGGQDSKVISIKNSEVDNFVINRKCAAGTGAYIEELANRLEISISKLPELDKGHDKPVVLNSYCTVFAGQEVIKILMHGERVENLIHALYESVIKRVLEMTAITTNIVIFSGGVMQYHSPLLPLFQSKLPGKKLSLASNAQFCGALGAALFKLCIYYK